MSKGLVSDIVLALLIFVLVPLMTIRKPPEAPTDNAGFMRGPAPGKKVQAAYGKGERPVLEKETKKHETMLFPFDFSPEEFQAPFSVEGLSKVIRAERYPLSLKAPENTITRLNELLTVPDFYDMVLAKKGPLTLSRGVMGLAEKTKDYRKKGPYSALTEDGQRSIQRLNRLLLEEAYPQDAPRWRPAFFRYMEDRNIFSQDGTYLAPKDKGKRWIEGSFLLLGIVNAGVRQALIRDPGENILVLKRGDTMDGLTVIKVDPTSVVLKLGKKEVELKVFEIQKKK